MGLVKTNELKLCFLGHGYEDILLYLTGILAGLGIKVHINDLTKDHDFYRFIPHIKGIDPLTDRLDTVNAFYSISGPGTTEGEQCEKEAGGKERIEKEDGVICLYDYEINEELKELTIIVTDEHRKHLEILEKNKDKITGEKIMVIREYCGASMRRLEDTASKLGVQKVYVLPLSEKDRKAFIKAEYSEKKQISGISTELRKTLEELVKKLLPDIDNKDFRRAYKLYDR